MAACVAAICAVAALPGQVWAAGEPNSYVFDPEARPITGAATTSDARRLDAGATYRDSIRPGGTRIYRLDLDAKTNAYVSAVAVPELGTETDYGDRISVSLQDREGSDCSSNDARFGTVGKFSQPLAAYAYRTIEEGAHSCQEAGPYFLVVERTDEETADSEPWDLEIRHVSEPGLEKAGSGPSEAPSEWPSASPAPVGGQPRAREGGTSFYDAAAVTDGEWTAKIEPGASLFYKVPVDWGRQLFASADLGSSGGEGFVSGAFAVSLYNPARGFVDSANSVAYDGKQKTTALDPLPPVAYENRFGSRTGDKDMRFAGWYYLKVALNPEVGEKFGEKPYGLTLRVDVKGQATSGPGYDGPAGDFAVTDDDRDVAADGPENDTMVLVAAGGIGAGTVLVVGLGVWTLLARRRGVAQGAGQGHGPAPGSEFGAGIGPGPGDFSGLPPQQNQQAQRYGPPPAR